MTRNCNSSHSIEALLQKPLVCWHLPQMQPAHPRRRMELGRQGRRVKHLRNSAFRTPHPSHLQYEWPDYLTQSLPP